MRWKMEMGSKVWAMSRYVGRCTFIDVDRPTCSSSLSRPPSPQTPAQTTIPTLLKLHLLCKHTIHGTVTGLAQIRTMASVEDGLDRLLVSLKDAKVRFGWVQGEDSTQLVNLSPHRSRCWNGLEEMSPRYPYIRMRDVRRW